MERFNGLPLVALVAFGCTYSQPWQSFADGPGPPVPFESLYAGLELQAQDETLAVFEDPALDGLPDPSLSKVPSEEEFKDWIKAARAAADARDIGQPYSILPAAPPSADMVLAVGALPPAAEAAPFAEVVVTGSSLAGIADNREITNNQKAGVDEGGILKQIDQHLVILQDGRLFVTDLMPGGHAGLRLSDHADVYRSSDEDTWHDEVLVAGRTILVKGYSYREEATEYAVLNFGKDGKVAWQATF